MDNDIYMYSVLDNNNHSKFILNYRLIMVVYENSVTIDEGISDRLKQIFDYNSRKYNITLTAWRHGEDYIDVTFRAHPNTELSKFINAYKSAGSRLIKSEFIEIRNKLSSVQFWNKSFCLLSFGIIEEDVIRSYLERQRPVQYRGLK